MDISEAKVPDQGAALAQSGLTTLLPATTNNVSISNTTEELPDDITQEVWLRGILITFYIVIFIVGISGNLLVVFVVVRNKSMQTITNIFITNLAVSDIMMCLLAVPFTPLSAFLKSWVFGDALCHIVPMTLGVSVYVSTLTSTAIAIDRYLIFYYVHKQETKHLETFCFTYMRIKAALRHTIFYLH